MTNQGC